MKKNILTYAVALNYHDDYACNVISDFTVMPIVVKIVKGS
jgi:hypothetical protein